MLSSQFSVSLMRYPVRGTPMTPGSAPHVFVMPNKILAYFGDKS